MFSFIFWEGTSNLNPMLLLTGLIILVGVTFLTTVSINFFGNDKEVN